MLDKDRIIGSIAKITQGVETTPPKYAPKLPPGLQAEQLLGLLFDYSSLYRNLFRQTREEVLQPDKPRVLGHLGRKIVHDHVSTTSELVSIAQEMSLLWSDPLTQRVFVNKLTEAAEQLDSQGNYPRNYRLRKKELTELDKTRRTMLGDRFQKKVKSPQQWKISLARNNIERDHKVRVIEFYERDGLMKPQAEYDNGGKDKKHADRAAMGAFERISSYRKQLSRDHFIMTPSRQALLEQVVATVARDGWVLLQGETGTGKSMLAKTVSQILNGEAPLYASGEKWGDVRTLVGVRSMDPQGAFFEFGPLTASLTGCYDSREMQTEMQTPIDKTTKKGRILQLDELNKFDQDALMGSLNLASTYQPGENFTMSQLPGVNMRRAMTGSSIVATMNPASVRYDRKELDPSIVRRFKDGTINVDYLEMSPENPELYEAFLAALMDQNGRIRIDSTELAPAYTQVDDTDKKVKKQVLSSDPKHHGFLYRFALASHEVHKSFKHEANVGSTASNQKYLEKNVLDMEILMRWMAGYELEIDAGVPFETYMQGNISRFYQSIDTPDDKATFKAIMQHFNISVEAPRPAVIRQYDPMTPLDIGYLSPKVPRAVEKNPVIEAPPSTKIYKNPDSGEVRNYLDQPFQFGDQLVTHGVSITQNGEEYTYIGINPDTNKPIWIVNSKK